MQGYAPQHGAQRGVPRRNIRWAQAGLCASAWSTTAVADITFLRGNATASANPLGDDRYDVVMRQLVNCCGIVRVGTNGSTDAIRWVVVENNPDAPGGGTEDVDDQMQLYISDPGSVRVPLLGVESILNVEPTKTMLRIVELMIDGSLGSPNGSSSIGASKINTIEIGGDLHAKIIADNITGSSSGSGVMDIKVDGDVVRGGVCQNEGVINSIEIGIPGGSGGNVVNEAGFVPEFWSSVEIGSVQVHGDFEGRIGSNNLGYAGHPIVGSIQINGNFVGSSSMEMESLESLTVGGDFNADLVIAISMINGDVTYDIGGTFASTASISLPADGLVGQVLINSGDTSNLWDGNIFIGSTALIGPDELDYTTYYTQLSSELGGGAVGHAPFNFHQRETAPPPSESMDCNPYQNEVRALALSEKLDFVEISHYGPVYADGTGPHFRVEFLPGMEVNPVWVDKTSMFEIDSDAAIPNPTGTSDGTASRVVTIKAVAGNKEAFKAAGKWRIRPIQGKVKCGSVVGNPNVRYTSSVVSGDLGTLGIFSWYQFDVLMELQPGIFALDSGNGTQASDLAAWMLTPFETNADGETNTQDFIDMANQFTGN